MVAQALSVEDRLAINDLFIRYATSMDNGDVEGVVGCYTEDAVLLGSATGDHRGHQAIRAFATRYANFHASGAQLRHFITNIIVTPEEGGAKVTAYLLTGYTQDGQHERLRPGHYICHVVKTDGEWLFKSRFVAQDSPMGLNVK
ncbi:nuclear transport factor 2 family protein [Rhizobium jaguaris]|uniref:nuclear transport factor 2 family protein n=1 Tax=Rhizobium jaguaris TaxID=1312183 RepID=UPI0039BEDE31